MLEGLTEYIKNISFFLIFMAFVGIILPDAKYKNYINVVLGLILIIILLQPIIGFFYGEEISITKMIDPALIDENNSTPTEHTEYKEIRNEMVLENFTMLMEKQVGSILQPLGYEILNFSLDYVEETGEILEMNIEVVKVVEDEVTEKLDEKPPLIRIDPIEITDKTPEKVQENMEDEEIKKLKVTISDFYNLDEDNIHIKVVEK